MLNFLKTYFHFNRSEKNGILILIVIILVLFIIPEYLAFVRKPVKVYFEQYSKEITAFEAALQADTLQKPSRKFNVDFERVDGSLAENKLHPFPFDPNGLSAEKWREMGLSERQIKTIMNYESKGGKFYHKEDLRKIYGITESEYVILAPYISVSKPDYDNKIVQKSNWTSKFPKAERLPVDINTADSVGLMKLKGIGSSFARRIIRYRNLLGGFYAKEQLFEVYGMDSLRFAQFSGNCTVGAGPVHKINLNTATVAELKKHPYFDYYLAKSIVDYRIIHGSYDRVEQLRFTPMFYEDLYKKIAPYLIIE
ncbi:MAG TPA: helix-hairpin-helix domain-containing protein [Bacteroidales bacterium]